MPIKDPEERRRYQREWVARRREEYFSDKSCARCGTTEELRLDHVDPAQKITHRIWSWSQVKRDEEIVKCQVLCEPCHKKKTMTDMDYKDHGTHYRYKKGCRCAECTEGHRIETAVWRKNKRERRVRIELTT